MFILKINKQLNGINFDIIVRFPQHGETVAQVDFVEVGNTLGFCETFEWNFLNTGLDVVIEKMESML